MKNLTQSVFFLILIFLYSSKSNAQTCSADAGTVTVTQTNGIQTTLGNGIIQVVLCPGGSVIITSNNNFILPTAGCPTCNPEFIYAIYSQTGPTTNNPLTDPNWTGYFWTGIDFPGSNTQGLNTNSAGSCSPLFGFPQVSGYATMSPSNNTFIFVPITADDGDDDASGSLGLDTNGDLCYDFGTPISITFLNPVSFLPTSSCNANVSIQINGGYPQFFPALYTLTNTGSGTLSSNSISSGGTVIISGLTAGQTYSFSVNDGNGCTSTFSGLYSGAPTVSLTPSTATLCLGGCVNLTSNITSGVATGIVTFTNNQCVPIPDGGIGATNGSPSAVSGNWASSIINVNSVGDPNWDTGNPLSVGLNISHTYDADLNIYLQAPNGTYYLLSQDNGGAGDNYTSTVFTATAVSVITTTGAPYSGSYKPQGTGNNFSGLNGTPINGNWKLWIADDVVGDVGTLLNWSITFGNQNTYTFVWSPTTGLSSSTSFTPTACPTTSTTYTLSVTNSLGCTASATSAITLTSGLTINVPPATICNGNSTILTATGATSYTWSPSTGLNVTTGSTVIANPTITTTYTVNGSTGGGCGFTTVVVTVSPTLTIVVPPLTICNGQSGVLSATGGVLYSWSPSTGLSATTGSTVTANPSTTTTYTISGSNASGCTSSTTTVVTVNALPVITASSITICNGSSGTLNATGAVTYTWSPSTGLNATTGSSVIANPTVTTTYTIHGTNANGCTKNKNVIVTVNPTPVLTSNSISICNGASGTLTVSGATTYSWSPSTGLNVTTGASLTANPTVTTTYTIIGTSTNGCTNVSSSVVTVNSVTATITPNGPTTWCGTGSVVLTASSGTSYQWYKNNVLINGATNQNYTATTTASYTVKITTICGTVTSLATQVIKYTLPTVTIAASGSTTICSGTSVTLNSTVSPSTVTYKWYKSGTAINGATNSSYNASASGLYTVIITNTVNGCTKTSSQIQVIVKALPTASITPSGSATMCIGDTLTLFAITNTGIQYQWKKSGLNINGATNSTYDAMVAGGYRILVTSIYGCQKLSAQKTITTVVCKIGELENDLHNEITLYPNPTDGVLNINAEITIDKIECFNSLGELVFQKGFENEIDLSNLADGNYLIKLDYSNGKEYKIYKIILSQ